ncbi:hypothetical protein [Micromonospora sp. 4G55]|uniref:hypothetical protein n=1 Tax=Micromonospora sp. 4G55 TaxID=2806102 RepID=UPI001A50C01B|nr:hypothetical protein [Micromonospora sp. 4G55]MBM0256815.1 hypothetical protein [Micromonospora sp. 4G55]
MNVPRTSRRRRAAWAAAAAVTAVLAGSAPAVAQSSSGTDSARAKVDAAVLDSVTAGRSRPSSSC